MDHSKQIAKQFNCKEEHVSNIITLIDEGNTIPFIARYRKEMHGSMDDQLIREIADRLEYLRALDQRKEEVRAQITAQEKMTDEIEKALNKAETLAEVEDIYRPFKPKRKTRASVAKEKGLEPLANEIFLQEDKSSDPLAVAASYVSEEKNVKTAEEALAGALDIIAEIVSDNAEIRKELRRLLWINGSIVTEATDKEKKSVYTQYYEYSEPVKKIASHRVLAVDRGEKEGFLKVKVDVDMTLLLSHIYNVMVKGDSPYSKAVRSACEDALSRLIYPSVSREIRALLTDIAAEGAIKLFASNLRQLLMQPPVKGKVTIGLDPGYRTGCKVAVVDETGKVLDTTVIYPTHSEKAVESSRTTLKTLIQKYAVQVIAIGNGTASKETEIFTVETLKSINSKVQYMIVNEAGASVYSASKAAAKEMPDFDLTLRSAVSIARRLQDPLAELVKIEPNAIGVGQYQHDMPAKRLSEALNGVVEDCVNSVGVDLNTASPSLLTRVSGLSETVCGNIVAYREENGAFKSRSELKKVPKLGPKAFEQCAGFLRVPESKNPLDNTSVHPESYVAADMMLKELGYDKSDIKDKNLSLLAQKADIYGKEKLANKLGIGIPTLEDMIKELVKPGRDPRDELPAPFLRSDILDIKDVKEGMTFKGTVRNVIDFGAFVDIGVHQDGLVHISQISDKFIKHPSEVLKVGDIVNVKILSVDTERGKISLTMKM